MLRLRTSTGCCFVVGPRSFLWGVGKGFFSALDTPGAQDSTASRACMDSPKQALRPVQGHICISRRGQSQKKPYLPRTGFSSTSPRIHQQNQPSPQWTGLSVASAARIEIPRARDVEIQTLLTQRSVLKGRLVHPFPPRGLQECHDEISLRPARASSGP